MEIKRPISSRRNFRWQGLKISDSASGFGEEVVGVAEMRQRYDVARNEAVATSTAK